MIPRLMPIEEHLLNLAQKGFDPTDREYETPEEAHEILVVSTDKDFEYDVDAWVKWLKENTEDWDHFGIVGRALKKKP
jgi:hypothetical protein